MKESDLYPPLKRFLESRGYEVKGDGQGCDAVAVRGKEAPVVVELKLSLNLGGMAKRKGVMTAYRQRALAIVRRWDLHGLLNPEVGLFVFFRVLPCLSVVLG